MRSRWGGFEGGKEGGWLDGRSLARSAVGAVGER